MKWTCYIICWWGDLLLPYYLQSIYAALQRYQYHCRFPLQAWRLILAIVSTISHLCQRKVIFYKPQWQTKKEEEVWEVQQISAMLFTWCDNTQEERGCAVTSSLGAFACSNRDRDPEHIQFRFHQPMTWCITSETWQQVSHPRTEERQQVTWRARGKKCSPFTFHLPSA